MRICIITPYYNEYPNAMASAEKMATAFAKQHQVTVITTRTYGARRSETKDSVRIRRLSAFYIPEPANYVFTYTLLWNLWRTRKKFDIYIINKYMWPTAWSVFFLKLLKKKVVLATDAFQGFDWWSWSRLVNIVMFLYAHTIGYAILKTADHVVLYHEGLVKRAQSLRLRFSVIHNGIDPDVFTKATPANDIVQKKDEIIVAYIGRLDQIKGYLDYLAVAKDITATHPNIFFYLVGNTLNREDIVRRYQSKNIIFTGVRKDIPSFLKAVDILVLPTYGDGLPNVIMEAMAAGLPCISTTINGIPYLIKHQETGLLFQPGDKKTLRQHILSLCENEKLRQSYGLAGHKKIIAEFNWNLNVNQYYQLFDALLRKTTA